MVYRTRSVRYWAEFQKNIRPIFCETKNGSSPKTTLIFPSIGFNRQSNFWQALTFKQMEIVRPFISRRFMK